MTAAARRNEPAPPTGCWCCGRDFDDTELIRLGEHPEVGLCRACARWAKRRADALQHEQHPTAMGRLRGGIDVIRNNIIQRGWHERGWLGALLRRVDQHLP